MGCGFNGCALEVAVRGGWWVVCGVCWVRWVTVVHLVHGGLEEGHALSLVLVGLLLLLVLVLLILLCDVQSHPAKLQVSHS